MAPLVPRPAPGRKSGRGGQGARDTPSAQTRTEPHERPRMSRNCQRRGGRILDPPGHLEAHILRR
eukprot:830154-Alexandrium_andersonii.AAC.1